MKTLMHACSGNLKLVLAATVGLVFGSSAFATFIIDPNPGGTQLNLANANNVPSSTGTVLGDTVTIGAIGNADFASGNATIKPEHGGTLTELIFTPANPNLFGDFSFRGQLTAAAGGVITLIVQDNQGNAPQTFTFTSLGQNTDFTRIGVISNDGETIQSVTLVSNFKEQKQTEFSLSAPHVVPEPTTFIAGALLLLPFGASALRIVRNKRVV